MPLALKNNTERWTYADYLTWPDDERWEIIDGVAYAMCPAPTTTHQRILRNLGFRINSHLVGKNCELFMAPFDVRLADNKQQSDNYTETVVQPDIVVICDQSKIDKRGCKGAPDIVVEILSPTTASNDIKTKFDLYQRHGVKEYWVIHPAEHTLLVYKIEADGMYGKHERYADDDKVPVPLLGDLVIDLGEVFAE
jgi:Uma2 family endonuclease